MTAVASTRLVRWAAAALAASPLVIAFPSLTIPLLTFDLALAAAALFDWLLAPRAALDAFRTAPERMSVLGTHTVAIVMRNRSRVALRVKAKDTAPLGMQAWPEQCAGVVPPQGELRLEYQVKPLERGRHVFGPIHLAYRSILGFWERRMVVAAAGEVRVYPNLALLHRYHVLARSNHLETLGIRRERLRRGAWEFESLRDYVPGDDVRMIDWKATARRQKPIFKNLEAERNQTILLLIDSGRLMQAEVGGAAKLDHAINAALVLAHVALARGDRVGLCTFSHKVHAWVAPRSHVAQIRLLTESLYNLRGDLTETDHGRCLRLVASRHSKRALLVVFTDFVDASTAAGMVAHIKLAARRHLVLFAALGDPFLERAARSHPDTPFQGFRKAAAIDLVHDRREVLERLRQMGAFVLDVEPTELTPPLINRYMQIALRGLL